MCTTFYVVHLSDMNLKLNWILNKQSTENIENNVKLRRSRNDIWGKMIHAKWTELAEKQTDIGSNMNKCALENSIKIAWHILMVRTHFYGNKKTKQLHKTMKLQNTSHLCIVISCDFSIRCRSFLIWNLIFRPSKISAIIKSIHSVAIACWLVIWRAKANRFDWFTCFNKINSEINTHTTLPFEAA